MTHISEIPAGTLVKQAHAGVKLIADQYPEAAAILREAITRLDVLREVHQLARQEAQPVIPEGLIKAINRLLDNDGSRGCFDALEQHRAKTELELLLAAAQQNEPQNIPENIPAQPVSEPYKLNGWISVKDDTPTESGNYWCYLGKDFERLTKQCVMHFDVRHHEFQDYRVTHWMHLPAEPAQEV